MKQLETKYNYCPLQGKEHSHDNTQDTSGALTRSSIAAIATASRRRGLATSSAGSGSGSTSCAARGGVLVACNLVGKVGNSGGRADLLSVLDGSVPTGGIALVLETACDAREEVLVAADALDVELAASSDAATGGVLVNAGLLYRQKRLASLNCER
jgi:hypothetical protein